MKSSKNNKIQVALLFGGQSTEHNISLLSSINVIKFINKQKYNLILIGIDKDGRWILCNEHNYLINIDDPINISLLPSCHYLTILPGQNCVQFIDIKNGLAIPHIDIVFSLLHGAHGEDGSIQGLLRLLNIPFIGSDILSSAICMDKDMTKRVLNSAKIFVTPSITLLRSNKIKPNFKTITNKLGSSLFIKPAKQGSSIGVSKVNNLDEFHAALNLAFSYDNKILIEQRIIGREIETSILGNAHPKVSVCGEIITDHKFYDYETKYIKTNAAKIIIPAKLTIPIANKIKQIAKKSYLILGCTGMARIDFFLSNKNKIILNEVNTLPGFTNISMYPKLWEASGLSYTCLIEHLLSLAITNNK